MEYVNPIIEYGPGPINPIHEIGSGEDNEIIITKDNPANVRGGKLFCIFKGGFVYTDINDTIVIDPNSNNLYIYHQEDEELTPADEREYLLLLYYSDDTTEFRGITGRQVVFDELIALSNDIDFDKSMILAETTKMKDMISIYAFMKLCVDKNLVKNNSGFDPDEYGNFNVGNLEEVE